VSRPDRHVPEDLLVAFVEGDVDENLAVHVAQHLDECVACATRAVALEPLAAAFAAVEDPIAPDDLPDAILAVAERPERGPTVEIAVGATLLLAAAGLAVVGGDPVAAVVDLGRMVDALSRVGGHVIPGVQPVVVGAMAVAMVALFVFARSERPFGELDRRSP
jgi:anti-sigma factor RsiW